MPFSSDKSQPWEKITKKWVTDMLGVLIRSADGEDELDDWKERKFDRDETETSYIIGQFQNDLSIFRTSIMEFVKHPNAIFMQFRGEELDQIDMWRWDSGPLDEERSAEEKYLAFKDGDLHALDENEKEDVFKELKSEVKLIAVAHGEPFPRINGQTKQPEEAAGGFSGAAFAEAIGQVLQRIAANGVKDLYTRFIVCNIVMPQERAVDINSFMGNYVRKVHASHPEIDRVEASGTPFIVSVGSAHRQVRRKLFDYPVPIAADTLIELGWPHKFRVVMAQGQLTDDGSDVTLTAFERSLFVWSQRAVYPLFKLFDDAQLLLAKASTSAMDKALADSPRWRMLALLILSTPFAESSGKDVWVGAQQIEIGGETGDFVEMTGADGRLDRVENLCRDLSLFKEKMAHFHPALDPSVPDAYRLALKTFIQGQFRFLNAVEKNYAPLESQQPNRPGFSCLAKLGDARNDQTMVNLSLIRNDAAFNAIAREEIYAQTDTYAPTGIAWQSIRVKNRAGTSAPDRAAAGGLVAMSDQERADALLFDVTLWPATGGPLRKEVSFTVDTSQKLVSCIDDCINARNVDYANKISTINKWHERGLFDACKTPIVRSAEAQGAVQVARPSASTEVAL